METINIIEGKKLIEKNLGKENFELIDVRSPLEYKQGHIKNAKLMPLDEIDQWINTLNKNKTYLIYCRTGGRSGMAAQMLSAKNIKSINMMGGIVDWVEEDYPIEK